MTIYDDAVENMILTQEKSRFFARNVPFFPKHRFRTARRVFYDLLTSAEVYFFTESVLIKFSSLQLLISAKLLAQKWGRCITVYFPTVIEIWAISAICHFYREVHSTCQS